jgi:hypothetical protein
MSNLDGTTEAPSPQARTREAAKRLGVSVASLNRWRVYGGGPAYRKLKNSVVVYAVADLDAFVAAHPRLTCTGGAGSRPRPAQGDKPRAA